MDIGLAHLLDGQWQSMEGSPLLDKLVVSSTIWLEYEPLLLSFTYKYCFEVNSEVV